MKYNILITSIGSTGSQCYIKSLDKNIFNIIGCDAEEKNSFRNKVIKFYKLPLAKEKDYINKILNVCKNEKIDLLIPVMEPEIEKISKNREIFEKNDIKILLSKENMIEIFLNKEKTHNFFKENNVLTPRLYSFKEYKFPLIIKPKKSSGSKYISIINNEGEFKCWKMKNKNNYNNFIVQEYVKGEEISVDCFCDAFSNLVAVVPRKRIEIRNGLCFKTETFYDKKLIKIVKKLVNKKNIIGPINIQLIKKNDKYYFFEINPRIGGSYIASVKAGIDLNQYILDFIMNKKSKRMIKYKKLFMIRYWEETFYDL